MITLKIAESDACAQTEWHAGFKTVKTLGHFNFEGPPVEGGAETYNDWEVLKCLMETSDIFDFVDGLPILDDLVSMSDDPLTEIVEVCFTDPKINVGEFRRGAGGGVVAECVGSDGVSEFFAVPYDSGYLLGPSGQTMDRLD